MRLTLLIAAFVLAPAGALAQSSPSTTAVDAQNFWPSPGPQHAFSLASSDVQPHLSLGFGLVANVMSRPLVFREVGTPRGFDGIRYAITTDFLWSLGLLDRVQVAVAVPVVISQEGSVAASTVAGGYAPSPLGGTALRDLRFAVGAGIVQRARSLDATGPGLRVDLGGSIPIGDEAGYQGAASATFTPTVIADYRLAGLTVTGNLGARVREVAALPGTGWGSQVLLGAGVAYRPSRLDRLNVGVDYVALVPAHGAVQAASSGPGTMALMAADPVVPMELYFGARYAVDRARDIEFALGAGAPLTRAATTPEFRLIAGVAYSPHGYDDDRDGVIDADDRCIGAPEDRDGFQDQDGCPDRDNDGDRIADANDACPNAAEDADGVEDQDGCPDADNDDDDIEDVDDRCPTESAGDHPDPERPGCPVRDRDGDGVLDTEDRCPVQPQGARAAEGRPGCPLPDADGDGVPDLDDRCVDVARGDHSDRFRPGCPDPDRDHDGVANEPDRCPDRAETINGVSDEDGCPDGGAEHVTWSANVLVFDDAIRLRVGVRVLPPSVRALLDQAAQRILARGAELARVRVQIVSTIGAAATSEASRQSNLVRTYLAERGIASGLILAEAAPTAGPDGTRASGELRLRIETTSAAPASPPGSAPVQNAPQTSP